VAKGPFRLVVSPTRTVEKSVAQKQVLRALDLAGAVVKSAEDRAKMVSDLVAGIRDVSRPDAPNELGALKQYKIPDGAEGEQARQRFAREVEALKTVAHKNLLQLITANIDGNWMITKPVIFDFLRKIGGAARI
jgi:hypothetical protein